MKASFLLIVIFAAATQAYNDLQDPKVASCCCGFPQGGVNNILPDRKTECCFEEAFNPEQAVCCNGALFSVVGRYGRCCGAKGYDERFFTCCGETVLVASRVEDQCCGGTKAYNQKAAICCDGVVHKRGRNTRCCGNTTYNPWRAICCNGIKHSVSPLTNGCCGSITYNFINEVCCDPVAEVVWSSPQALTGVSDNLTCSSIDGTVNSFYMPAWDTCCCGRLFRGPATPYTGCCGVHLYDLSKTICCDGYVWPGQPEITQCCGPESYDPSTATCCDGELTEGKVGLCCGQNVFDPKNEICCNGHVLPGAPHNTKCCYGKYGSVVPYHITKELCCDGVVQPGGGGFKCCGQRSHCTRTYSCCNGALIPRSIFRQTHECEHVPIP